MPSSFLASVASQIFHSHPDGLADILVVFNNRRAGLFLQREFLKLGDKPFFLPRIIGIDDLVGELSGLRIVPHEFLIFELYDIHCSLVKEPEPFEDFISLGETMLGDFSDIDLYNVPADKILGNLYSLKQLGEWNLDSNKLSDFQKRYLDFYNSLLSYYSELHNRLKNRNEAFSGMAYRHLSENIDTLAPNLKEKYIYFVGFNALSACESNIIKWFETNGLGKLICDGDGYYFNDPQQEAGLFLRQNALRHNINTDFGNFFADNEKTIHIVNCPEYVLQAKAAASIIDNNGKEENSTWSSGCAIVLADEKLLLPMLNSLPASIDTVNVTMGLPYSITGIHLLVTKIFALYINRRNNKFYHTDIVNLFSDNIISKLLKTNSAHALVSEKLYADKSIYLTTDEIKNLSQLIPEAVKIMFLFECDGQVDSILNALHHLVEVINSSGCIDSVVREQEALACLLLTVNYLDRIREKYNYILRLESLHRIYLRLANLRSIALYGEPLKEMQLLGILETRNLDFDRLVILSVNEGTLPSGRSSNSLIPFSLKRAFGLPTHEEKDAVYAYNFFRLIQRAKEVWLLYNSDAEGMGKGEPSRFILQIRNEMAARLPNIKVDFKSADVKNSQNQQKNIDTSAKDERTMLRLKDMAKVGFSPSALNRYRNCPMQFYLGDVLGVREQEELTEEVESNEIGTFIHKILCDIYSRDADKIIRRKTLVDALEELPQTLEKGFHDELLKGRSGEGKNRLYVEVSKMEITSFIKKEIEKLDNGHSIKMVLTDDKPITLPIKIDKPFINFAVNINGTTDRVDYYDGQLRIADYKSGGVNVDDLRVKKSIESPRDPSDKWFQVMTYAWLFCRSSGYNGSFVSGIFPLRALSSDFISATWEAEEGTTFSPEDKEMNIKHIECFETLLCDLLSELLNPAIDFTASPKKYACDYCQFKSMCSLYNHPA